LYAAQGDVSANETFRCENPFVINYPININVDINVDINIDIIIYVLCSELKKHVF